MRAAKHAHVAPHSTRPSGRCSVTSRSLQRHIVVEAAPWPLHLQSHGQAALPDVCWFQEILPALRIPRYPVSSHSSFYNLSWILIVFGAEFAGPKLFLGSLDAPIVWRCWCKESRCGVINGVECRGNREPDGNETQERRAKQACNTEPKGWYRGGTKPRGCLRHAGGYQSQASNAMQVMPNPHLHRGGFQWVSSPFCSSLIHLL